MALGEPRLQRYGRWQSKPAVLDERYVYGACGEHVPHPSKAVARQHARTHARLVGQGEIDCRRCWRGMVPEAWRCSLGIERHFHWGHSWSKRNKQREV